MNPFKRRKQIYDEFERGRRLEHAPGWWRCVDRFMRWHLGCICYKIFNMQDRMRQRHVRHHWNKLTKTEQISIVSCVEVYERCQPCASRYKCKSNKCQLFPYRMDHDDAVEAFRVQMMENSE